MGSFSTFRARAGNVRYPRAPCKGGAFQWVRIPPGNCSSRKLMRSAEFNKRDLEV